MDLRERPATSALLDDVVEEGQEGSQACVAGHEEEVGIVIRERRSLYVALPTPRRIDRVEVTLPGTSTSQQFPVGQVFDRACAPRTDNYLCR